MLSDPTTTAIIIGAIVLIATLALVIGGVLLYRPLKTKKQGYPLEAEIEAALLPLVYQSIVAAYKTSEVAMDEMGQRLSGCDKKAFADMVYTLLPARIGGFDLTLIKAIVTPERFEQLVQNAFDSCMVLFYQFNDKYKEEFAKWQTENASG